MIRRRFVFSLFAGLALVDAARAAIPVAVTPLEDGVAPVFNYPNTRRWRRRARMCHRGGPCYKR